MNADSHCMLIHEIFDCHNLPKLNHFLFKHHISFFTLNTELMSHYLIVQPILQRIYLRGKGALCRIIRKNQLNYSQDELEIHFD